MEDYIVLEEKGKGLGLMAVRPLKKGIIIGIMRGFIIQSKNELKEVLTLEGSIYVVEINKKMWINAINLNCNVRFINHGCINNNCELVKLSETVAVNSIALRRYSCCRSIFNHAAS